MSSSAFARMLDIPGDVSAGLPAFDRVTIIGISVAIAGNIIISLALNLQKLAHKHIDLENTPKPDDVNNDSRSFYPGRMERVREASGEEDALPSSVADNQWVDDDQNPFQSPVDSEACPTPYGSSSNLGNDPLVKKRKPMLSLFSPRSRTSESLDAHRLPTRTTSENTRLLPAHKIDTSTRSNGTAKRSPSIIENGNESDYLKSKLWCDEKFTSRERVY